MSCLCPCLTLTWARICGPAACWRCERSGSCPSSDWLLSETPPAEDSCCSRTLLDVTNKNRLNITHVSIVTFNDAKQLSSTYHLRFNCDHYQNAYIISQQPRCNKNQELYTLKKRMCLIEASVIQVPVYVVTTETITYKSVKNQDQEIKFSTAM